MSCVVIHNCEKVLVFAFDTFSIWTPDIHMNEFKRLRGMRGAEVEGKFGELGHGTGEANFMGSRSVRWDAGKEFDLGYRGMP